MKAMPKGATARAAVDASTSVVGAVEGVGEAGAELSRREKQQIGRKVEGAVAAMEAGGSTEQLLELVQEGPFAAASAAIALEQTLLRLDVDGYPLRTRLTSERFEASLLELLTGADKKPSTVHKSVLNCLERFVEGYAAGANALIKAGAASRLHTLLKSWAKPHIAAGKKLLNAAAPASAAPMATPAATAPPPTAASVGSDAAAAAVAAAAAASDKPVGPAALLPHLLLLLIALCESSDDARSALVRSGMAETLLSLLEGPPKAEATILAVDALNGLGLTAGKLGEMCEEHPIRLATLELLSELDEEQRDALTPISTERRESARAAAADARHAAKAAAKAAKVGAPGAVQPLSAKQKLAARKAAGGGRKAGDLLVRGAPASAPAAATVAAGGGALVLPASTKRVVSGEEADTLVLRCRAEGCKRQLTADERLQALCTVRGSVECYVTVALEVRWGALVEIGRSEARTDEMRSHWWDELQMELPEGTPERVYLRFAVYEKAARTGGKPKLVASTGVTVQQVHEMQRSGDARGSRGVPLELRTMPLTRGGEPTAGKPCGTLWIEMCELIGFDEEAARISSSR